MHVFSMNEIWTYYIGHVTYDVSCVASLSSSPMASWDSKVSIRCALQDLTVTRTSSGYCFRNTMNSDILLGSHTVFLPTINNGSKHIRMHILYQGLERETGF